MNNTTVMDTGFITDSTTEVVYMVFNLNYLLKMIIKLLLSTGFSFIIGLEREMHSHPGGICTHILVGYGSCLFTMVSVNLRNSYPQQGADPARICAQIVSGMGFLGSATIFKSENYVKGINTAANLWISAAISMAIGVELWEFAFITAVFSALVLLGNNRYKRLKYGKKNSVTQTDTDEENDFDHDPLDAPYGDEGKND